nr:hypothetical protein [Tanacetum cinerariifolium]
MMKGSDIREQEKKAKLFNEWEKFTSTDWESIESYYHHFTQLINDLKRNKHFPKYIVANLKFLNNLQPEWKRHVTIAFQLTAPTKNNQRTSSNPCNRQIAQSGMNMSQDRQIQNVGGNGGNQFGQPHRRDVAYLQTQLLIAQKEEAGIQLQAEEFNFMAAADQKMALGYPNPSNLKKAQLKQQSLYNGNLLLEEHGPPAVYDSEETLELTQESREKIRFLKK